MQVVMFKPDLIRWSGLDAVISGVLFALGWVLIYFVGPESLVVGWGLVISHIGAIIAVTGIYLTLSEEIGGIGLLGYGFTIIAVALQVGLVMADELAAGMELLGPIGTVGFGLGYLLLGGRAALVVRTNGKLPLWAVILWAVGPAVTVIGLFIPPGTVSIVAPIGAVLFGAGFVWTGIVLIRQSA